MTVQTSNSRIDLHWSLYALPQSERCLRAQEIERIEGLQIGDAIICTNGVIWVTQEGDPQDYLLKQGDVFVAFRSGLVLVQAFEDFACRSCLLRAPATVADPHHGR